MDADEFLEGLRRTVAESLGVPVESIEIVSIRWVEPTSLLNARSSVSKQLKADFVSVLSNASSAEEVQEKARSLESPDSEASKSFLETFTEEAKKVDPTVVNLEPPAVEAEIVTTTTTTTTTTISTPTSTSRRYVGETTTTTTTTTSSSHGYSRHRAA